MENRVCLNCEYYKTRFLFLHSCERHMIMLSNYETANYTCDEWKPNIKAKYNFREVKRDDGCK